MISNDLTHISGAVLSDEDIRRVVDQKKIYIKTPRDEKSKNFYDPNEFENAIEGQRDSLGCLVSAGYLMKPDAYWDGNDFRHIGRSGFELKQDQHTVVRTFQWIKFSDDYCALHFGLHRNQMVGIIIGAGQIQPEWGPAPLYLTIWNSGKAKFIIRRDEPLSRLVFLRMTSGNVTGRITQESVVRDSIKEDLAEQTAREKQEKQEQATREKQEKLKLLALNIVGIILVVAAFIAGPLIFPFLAAEPRINSFYGGLLAGALGFLLVSAIGILGGLRKWIKRADTRQ